MPEAKAAPQLLILAEPLLREGLIRLLESSYSLATTTDGLCGSVRLVIWSCGADLPFSSLQRELEQLQERWQPAPVLLLLPGQTPYSSEDLLRLRCEGLLQQKFSQCCKQQRLRCEVDCNLLLCCEGLLQKKLSGCERVRKVLESGCVYSYRNE